MTLADELLPMVKASKQSYVEHCKTAIQRAEQARQKEIAKLTNLDWFHIARAKDYIRWSLIDCVNPKGSSILVPSRLMPENYLCRTLLFEWIRDQGLSKWDAHSDGFGVSYNKDQDD